MKKTMLIAIAMVITTIITAGNPNYYKAMGEALGGFATCENVDDYQALGNKFMVIANAENEEWLPLYYHAQCYILMSFEENSNPEKKDEYLDVAEGSIKKMLEMAPREPEVYVLQGLYYTGRLVVNPMERGQEYSQLSGQSVGRALNMEPENPRAKYMKIANDRGTAQFFGNDVSVYCDQAKSLYETWDDYKAKSPIHPRWGKDQVAAIVKSCK